MTVRLARAFLRGMCVLALTASAAAQVFTGRVDVSIADSTGSILPGADAPVARDLVARAAAARGRRADCARGSSCAHGQQGAAVASASAFRGARERGVAAFLGVGDP